MYRNLILFRNRSYRGWSWILTRLWLVNYLKVFGLKQPKASPYIEINNKANPWLPHQGSSPRG